jgi:thiol:disulfide interchange protein DsbC
MLLITDSILLRQVMKMKWTLAVVLVVMVGNALANDDGEVLQRLKAKYPKTQFTSVQKSQFNGLFEIIMGKNVAYTDAAGDYFLFGHIMDMATQRDLTAERQKDLNKVDVGALPLDSAITFVQGRGSRALFVFSDPDCHYCKKLEPELAKLDNVTIHVFPYPLQGLHPDALNKAISVWCSPNQANAWRNLLINNIQPTAKLDCPNPLAKNLALGEKLNVVGTPTLMRGDGKQQAGALKASEIDYWLDSK